MPLGPLDWFPRVLFESQRALDTELWCTLHVCRKNLWAIQSLDVQVRRIPMSSLAQFASGMRQLNCGSSSRFRIHLAQMWVKTNRTKTEWMDINTMLFLACDIRTSTWPTTNPISSRVSHFSVAPGGAVFFFSPLAEVRTRVSSKVWTRHPFGWRRWATCRVDGSDEPYRLCLFFSSAFIFVKHIKTNYTNSAPTVTIVLFQGRQN